MPLTITTSHDSADDSGRADQPDLQSVADRAARRARSSAVNCRHRGHPEPTGTLSGTPTTPGNYVFTVRCDAGGKADEQTLSIQVDPAGAGELRRAVERRWTPTGTTRELEPARGADGDLARLHVGGDDRGSEADRGRHRSRSVPRAGRDARHQRLHADGDQQCRCRSHDRRCRPDRAHRQRRHRSRRVLEPRDSGPHHADGAGHHRPDR